MDTCRRTEGPETYKRILENYGVEVSAEVLKAIRANEESDVFEGMIQSGEIFWIQWNQRLLERLCRKKNREFLAKRIFEF